MEDGRIWTIAHWRHSYGKVDGMTLLDTCRSLQGVASNHHDTHRLCKSQGILDMSCGPRIWKGDGDSVLLSELFLSLINLQIQRRQ